MAQGPTRREPVPSEEVGAKMFKLLKGKLNTQGFLDGNDVNVFITQVLDELAALAIMAEAMDVPKKGPHISPHRGAA